MSVSIPQPFRTSVTLTNTPLRTAIEGIPDHITLSIDQLPELNISVNKLPKVNIGVDPVELRLTEFPSIRGHLPAAFNVGFSVLGFELANIRLCGEAQIITEPYKANDCERCGPPRRPSLNEAIDAVEAAQAREAELEGKVAKASVED